MTTKSTTLLGRIDDAVFVAEKWVMAGFFSVMTLVVFADVTHRVFSSPGSRFAKVWGKLGVDPTSDFAQNILGPATLFIVAIGIAYAAFRERWGIDSSRGKALLSGAGAVIGISLFMQLFLAAFPNGLIWSQTLALSMMLWVGLVGASMAAKQRRHLALEFGSKIWPEKFHKPIRIVAALSVAAFCSFLAYLAFTLILDEYKDYNPEYGIGVYQSLALPKFIVYSALPYGFVMIIVRYFRGSLEDGEVNELEHLIKPHGEEPMS